MKIALCFILNETHVLNKEKIWCEWIEPNNDIINVYIFYENITKIKSAWVYERTIPEKYLFPISKYHTVPAYNSLLCYAMTHDKNNIWFCMMSHSSCPLISPSKFRDLFYKNVNKSIFSWNIADWNPITNKRGNLSKISKDLWLKNDPYFVLTKRHAHQIVHFMNTETDMTNLICNGGIANETLFAVILKLYNELGGENIIDKTSCFADWNRKTSATNPHLFINANLDDVNFIKKVIDKNEYAMFLNNVDSTFPDDILEYFIYDYCINILL